MLDDLVRGISFLHLDPGTGKVQSVGCSYEDTAAGGGDGGISVRFLAGEEFLSLHQSLLKCCETHRDSYPPVRLVEIRTRL